MRKTILAVAAIAALSTPAFAQNSRVTVYGDQNPAAPAEVTTGAVAGTAVGVGVSEGWFGGALGSSSAVAASTAGAATVGGVAGVGVAAGIDAIVQPCRGFSALFDLSKGACVNGNYVGYRTAMRY